MEVSVAEFSIEQSYATIRMDSFIDFLQAF
ncbi:hypothetical protein AvCA_02150 [Azotobacter vinelandii CA]|uniref:Uncharacterized protein n=2 Tax=Azotobacter vinelandii TaxID=354 RepID=C1DH69_AZOVD|nr:hypothetical protein Avin_02150 [Azotobacter vinelandii DJ]AGK15667.1 hypothetical protein AvCA_02150 [Azotobacter vinelandii CA]AGK19148.1 hypothetical protein AvCA6_02150 [Azotobacter vinelandii CA6]